MIELMDLLFLEDLLLHVCNSHALPMLDCGLTTYGYTIQENLTLAQRLQINAAWLLLGNFNHVNFRDVDIVKLLGF